MNEIRKPASVLKNEMGEKLDNLVNEYLRALPAFVIRLVLQNVDRQLEEIEKEQYASDKAMYESALQGVDANESHGDSEVKEV